MTAFRKSIVYSAVVCSLSLSTSYAVPSAAIYDLRPKNHFRGGSRGKGGKIKYTRK